MADSGSEKGGGSSSSTGGSTNASKRDVGKHKKDTNAPF